MKRMKNAAKYLLYILLVAAVATGCSSDIREAAERCYYEGQRDALQGNVRIKLNSDSVHVWTSTPWSDGVNPIYQPSYLDTKTVSDR